ncbi:MAG: hypothetical protein IT446_14835 [Phycisphaerales bacterium]|nr:hypothetical protein [Phycisphaerales bacterium]
MNNIQPGILFAVILEKDGGEDGGGNTSASWTYTATSISGETLGRELSPQSPRTIGKCSPATEGQAYYSANGELVLSVAFERRRCVVLNRGQL